MVDSSYLLQRSFHGARDTYTVKFGHIGGLYQFLTTVRKLIKTHKINKVVLVWDGENSGIYRHRIDSNYKSNRKNKEWYRKIEKEEDAEIKKDLQELIAVELKNKSNNIVYVIKNLDGNNAAIDAEIERLQALKRRNSSNIEKIDRKSVV